MWALEELCMNNVAMEELYTAQKNSSQHGRTLLDMEEHLHDMEKLCTTQKNSTQHGRTLHDMEELCSMKLGSTGASYGPGSSSRTRWQVFPPRRTKALVPSPSGAQNATVARRRSSASEGSAT